MDLSKLKWALIIAAVVGIGWLLTGAGTDYMFNKFTEGYPGIDLDKDEINELGLSRLGGFMMMTFRYARAQEAYEAAIERYPDGKNVWNNYYQLARALERQEDYRGAARVINLLRVENADQYDERVPDVATLELRLRKLIEVHEMDPRNFGFRR